MVIGMQIQGGPKSKSCCHNYLKYWPISENILYLQFFIIIYGRGSFGAYIIRIVVSPVGRAG